MKEDTTQIYASTRIYIAHVGGMYTRERGQHTDIRQHTCIYSMIYEIYIYVLYYMHSLKPEGLLITANKGTLLRMLQGA